jgi:cobalamin biosynthesis Mg chelatase CobN
MTSPSGNSGNVKQKTDPTRMFRGNLAKFTSRHREVKNMSDDEFLNYSVFLMNQQDVNATAKGREALETTKNAKSARTIKQIMTIIGTVLVVFLVVALFALLLFAIIYLMIYFKKDKLKRVIDFIMLGSALSFVFIFVVFLILFFKMSETIKKIMTLL